MSIAVGILDGLGITMFLPLLQMVGEGGADAESMGRLGFVVEGMERMGIQPSLTVVLLIMCLFFLFKGVASFIQKAYDSYLLEYFSRQLRLASLDGLNHLRFKRFATSDLGRIQNAMTGEVDRLVRAHTSYFGTIQQGIMVAVYMSFALLVDARFAILVTIGGALTNLFYQLVYKKTKKASVTLNYYYDVYEGQIIQHVNNYKYLRATGMIPFFGERLKHTILNIEANRIRIGILSSLLAAAREPILVAVVATVILVQVSYLGGALGAILISLLFFYRALNALTQLQNNWNQFLGVYGAMESMKAFQAEIKAHRETNGTETLNSIREGLVADRVGFRYGDTPILRDISLVIRRRESVAFVGESGSGKTTLVNVLAGLLPADAGEVRVDGQPLQLLDRNTYQRRIGYVTQEPVIFNDSIYNNITLWAESTPDNLMRFDRALRQASLHDFVKGLTQGKDCLLGNNGINLSGGQRQRVSIARELYKDIDLLILDEATSALDSETERAIRENIDALKGQYTLLIVAHRLSTIRNVDRVILMQDGRIVEEGSFDELARKQPRFRRMVELQELS
jgi:ABC-type multidrug transport system fused ATPase/permease subunit